MKVKMRVCQFSDEIEIVFLEEKGKDELYVARPVDIVFEKYEPGKSIEPTLRISRLMSHEFLEAWAKALDEHGIKTPKQLKAEGVLDATKYHLEDLRKLLKLHE